MTARDRARFIFVWLLAGFAGIARADLRVASLLPDLKLVLEGPDTVYPGTLLPLYTADRQKLLAQIEILSVKARPGGGFTSEARAIMMTGEDFVKPNDVAVVVSYEVAPTRHYPGRFDLLQWNAPRASARYKPLVYQGFTGETAATLQKGEQVFDLITQYHYAVTDRVTLSTLILALPIVPNIAVKYAALRTPSFWYSPKVSIGYLSRKEQLFLFDNYLTIPSYPKFLSHTNIRVSYLRGPNDAAKSVFGSSIQSGVEYIFDNWDRLLYGPSYNIDTQSVGGYLTYMMIWDSFHLTADLQVKDLTKLELSLEGYLPSISMYWRFL